MRRPARTALRRIAPVRIALVAVLLGMLLLAPGCTRAAEEPALTPKITPPAIKTAGTLKAGVDLTYPPFAGKDAGQEVGLDIDVAAAIASELGLKLELVDVKPSEAATALAEGTADIVMSVPLSEQTVLGATLAGTYLTDGPGFFVKSAGASGSAGAATGTSGDASATAVPALTVSALGRRSIGAQDGSPAFWSLEYDLGEGAVTSFPTLRDALSALDGGKVDVVAGDAVVAAYIARDFPGIAFAGPAGSITPLAVAVATENSDLETAVRDALDALAAGGVLDTIRTKWVGDLPELPATTSGN